jgi:LmbE family N-acetylglucosaminyl deacetylase
MTSPLTIAAVYAHPDDGEFFAAGTLAKWVKQGHKVHAICATRGDLGTKQRDASGGELGARRASELGAGRFDTKPGLFAGSCGRRARRGRSRPRGP